MRHAAADLGDGPFDGDEQWVRLGSVGGDQDVQDIVASIGAIDGFTIGG